MPLLMAFRRWWAVIFVALLSLPTIGLLLPAMPGPMRTVLAPEARWWEHASERLDPCCARELLHLGELRVRVGALGQDGEDEAALCLYGR